MGGAETILVTGGQGLIGHAVAARLSDGDRRVISIDQNTSSPVDGVTSLRADLNDIHRLYRIMSKHEVGSIVHCGGVSGPMVGRDNPHDTCNTNIMGTANVLEAAALLGCRRFVYCSSTSAYGHTPRAPVTEDAPLRPTDVYGTTKASGDMLTRAYADGYGVDGVALRISWVFGPRRTTDCVIRTMIENSLQGRPTRLGWGADYRRQYVYVDDVASAIVAALDAEALHQRAYNITGDTWLTISEVADAVRSVIPGTDVSVAPGADPHDYVQERFDISAARRDLGYAPRFSMVEGVDEYAAYLRSRPEGGSP